MPPVKSSMFSTVDYKDGTLSVTLAGGKTYHHDDVPPGTYAKMMEADSMGRFYNTEVKGKHPHRKTETE